MNLSSILSSAENLLDNPVSLVALGCIAVGLVLMVIIANW